jgi:hypothetical protein
MASSNYFGYIPTEENIDWGKLASGLATTVYAIGQDREAKREELDKILSDNNQKVSEIGMTSSQDLNELIIGGVDNVRNNMKEWNDQLKNGLITPKQYRALMNNSMTDWSNFSESISTFDKRLSELMKRQQDGTGSALELAMLNKLSNMADFRNKAIMQDKDSGRMYYSALKPDGTLDTSNTFNMQFMNMPGNILDPKLDLNKKVTEYTKAIAEWSIENGIQTIEDARKNPAYDKMKQNAINAIMSNDRAIASILSDNSNQGYGFYFDENDLNYQLNQMVEQENKYRSFNNKPKMTSAEEQEFRNTKSKKLISVKSDGNTWQPSLNEQNQKDAYEVVNSLFEAQIARSIELDEPVVRSGGGGSGSGSGSNDGNNLYEDLYRAWTTAKPGVEGSATESANMFNSLSQGRYKFEWVKGGLQVLQPNPNAGKTIRVPDPKDKTKRITKTEPDWVPIGGPVKNLDDIQRYFYSGNWKTYDKEKNAFNSRRGGGVNSNDPLGLGIKS